MPGNSIVYLVQAWDWHVRDDEYDDASADDWRTDVRPHPHHEDVWQAVTYYRYGNEGGIPVRAFHDPARAEAFRRQQEQERRENTNPFRYGITLEDRTHLDNDRLRDWLLDGGLTPPSRKGDEDGTKVRSCWERWWQTHRGRVNAEQRQVIGRAVRQAMVWRALTEEEVAQPVDPDWLDAQMRRMDQLTPQQRSSVRMNLLGISLRQYPQSTGERDHYKVEKKWREWWDQNCGMMTEFQKAHVWEALDRIRFFEVVELSWE